MVKESVTDVVKRVIGLKTAPRDQVDHRGIVSQVVAEIPTLEIHMITTETDMPLYPWTDSDPIQIPMTEDHLHHHPGTPTTETEILTQDHHQSTTEEQGKPV